MTDPVKRLEEMDRVGHRRSEVLSCPHQRDFVPPERQGTSHASRKRCVRRSVRQHPQRFKGFASIPMDDPDAALRESSARSTC